MALDLSKKENRVKIIEDIKNPENLRRKAESFRQQEIFRDRQHKYVVSYLSSQFSSGTLAEMPVISSINVARRIVKQEASIYRDAPEREYTELTDEQKEVIAEIYEEMQVDTKLQKSNEAYKLQNQNHLQCLVKDGKFILRVLWNHQLDVIPEDDDPEKAAAYIISAFDRTYDQMLSGSADPALLARKEPNRSGGFYSDGIDQKIADADDYKRSLERYVVWTKESNFIMNGNGEIVSGDTSSPIPGYLPFIDISQDKEYEYFVRQGQAVTDFSVQLNGALSDLGNVNKMQGWAQAYLIGSQDIIPQNIKIGPNYILKLPVDPSNNITPQFGYANPNPDIEGSIQYHEMLISLFLSSRGIDPKLVSPKGESEKFTSGFDRLLAMIEKFEATKEDFALYERVEQELYQLIKAWYNLYRGTGLLSEELEGPELPENSEIHALFKKPELVQSEKEQVDVMAQKMELGLMSRKEAIMELRNVDDAKAEEIITEIDEEAQAEQQAQAEQMAKNAEAMSANPDETTNPQATVDPEGNVPRGTMNGVN